MRSACQASGPEKSFSVMETRSRVARRVSSLSRQLLSVSSIQLASADPRELIEAEKIDEFSSDYRISNLIEYIN